MTLITFDPKTHEFEYGSVEDKTLLNEIWQSERELEREVTAVGMLPVGKVYKPNAELSDMVGPSRLRAAPESVVTPEPIQPISDADLIRINAEQSHEADRRHFNEQLELGRVASQGFSADSNY